MCLWNRHIGSAGDATVDQDSPLTESTDAVDEAERLMQLFALCAAKPAPARLDILLDLRRHGDPRIVPFLLRVLQDQR